MSNSGTRRTSFQADRELEAVFDPISKIILGQFWISKDVEADLREGQDFGIYRVDHKSAAVRWRRVLVRRNGKMINQMNLYGNEFTIRYERRSGIDTEIHKVRKGLVDIFLYGFGDDLGHPYQYHILDFGIFREQEPEPVFTWWNTDEKGSKGAAFCFDQFSPELILKKWLRTS